MNEKPNKSNFIDIDKWTGNLKSIIFIGAFFWSIAGFYYSTEYGKEAFINEVSVRTKEDEALYNRITKTTNRNADWNLKQDNSIADLRKEVEKLKIENAYQKGLIEGAKLNK